MSVLNFTALTADGAEPTAGRVELDADALRALIPAAPSSGAGLDDDADPWARLAVFQAAFRSERHPRHAAAVAQWRGLMTAFALAATLESRYALSVETIAFDDDGLPPALREALARPPELTLLPGLSLDQGLSLVTLTLRSGAQAGRAVPIGLVSPTTLLAPAASASRIPEGAAPFLDGGLRDPLEDEARARMRRASWTIIAAFMRDLEAATTPLAAAEGRTPLWRRSAEALQRELAAFAHACEDAASASTTLEPAAPPERAWPTSAVLGRLDHTYVAALDPSAAEARILAPEAVQGGFRDLFLVDPALAETLETAPADLPIWDGRSLEDLTRPEPFIDAFDAALAQDAGLLRPEDFFTATALRMERTEACGHPEALRRWVLPLTPMALLVLDPEALDTQITLEDGSDARLGRTARVTLRLPLAGGAEHAITRLYAERPPEGAPDVGALLTLDGEDEYNLTADIAVWPDYATPAWPHNVVAFRANTDFDLTPLMGLSGAMVAHEILQAPDVSRRRAQWRGWRDPSGCGHIRQHLAAAMSSAPHPDTPHAPWLERLRVDEQAGAFSEFQRLRRLDALVIARPDAHGETLAGLVLVRRPAVAGPTESDAGSETHAPDGTADAKGAPAPQVAVGVDFGTTATVIQFQVDGEPEDAVLQPRVHRPVIDPDAGPEDAPQADPFFVLEPVRTPIPTIALRRQVRGPAADLAADPFGLDEIGFTHLAYFASQARGRAEALQSERLTYGLKWGVGKRPIAKRFLRHLVLLAAAELAARGLRPEDARWCFSYPEAFTSIERTSFRKVAVQSALDDVFGPGRATSALVSESMALVEHFADPALSPGGDTPAPVLAIDIGGGSSDVVLAFRDQILWRASFPIGGQTFVTDVIRANPQILQVSAPGDEDVAAVAAALRAGGADEDPEQIERARGLVDVVFASPSFQERFQKHYPLMWDEGGALLLRVCSSAALGGILWYAGRVLHQLMAREEIGRLSAERLVVGFGGRGSGVFRALYEGDAMESRLSQLCSTLIYAAEFEAEAFDPAQIRFTERTKKEIALGMLKRAGGDADLETSLGARRFLAPLLTEVAVSAPRGDFTAPPDAEARSLIQGGALPSGATVTIPDLGDFETYLQALAYTGGARLTLTPAGRDAWLEAVAARVRTQMASAPPRLSEQSIHYIEPPFITGLALLVRWLARNAAADYGRLVEVELTG